MRSFVAVDIPDVVRNSVRDYMDGIKGSFGDVMKWVAPENLHFTVKFLGEIPDTDAEVVERCMDAAADEIAPFKLTLEDVGFFPTAKRPRIVWIGTDGGCENLLEVYQLLEGCLELEGFDRDEKPFSPHLTIGRVKKHKDLIMPDRVPDFETVTFDVGGFSLVKSVLTPQGPIYETLYERRFGG
jgi:RNA 2',3'-cyclic 3'-phosphodiesterase